MVGEGELSAGPQFHPGSLTLFKVRAGPGSEGEEMEVWDTQAQRRAHRRSDPRVRLRRLSLLVGLRGHYGGLPRHCLTPLEYQTPGLILLDREETEAQLRDELALRSHLARQLGSRSRAGWGCSTEVRQPSSGLHYGHAPCTLCRAKFNWAVAGPDLQPQALLTPPLPGKIAHWG